MNAPSVVLLIMGCLAVVAGVSLIFIPAGVITGGVLASALGVLLLERGDRK